MKRDLINLLTLLFIFIFGLLFGIEISKKEPNTSQAVAPPFLDQTHYISRIENGRFIYEPMHPQTLDSTLEGDPVLVEQMEIDNATKMEHTEVASSGPIMNKKGKLDQFGKSLGSKFSEFTRATLVKSIGLFAD